MPEFITIDGEGYDHPTLGHIYSLLMCSNGKYIEDYGIGLSTKECFDFLLSLKGRGICAGFSTGYDINMMLRDFPSRLLGLLWEQGFCYILLQGTGYKVEYLPGKWCIISRLVTPGNYKKIEKSIKVWDVFGFFQQSFVKSLDQWLFSIIKGNEIFVMIEEMKEKRGQFSPDDKEQIRNYCHEECILLKTLMIQLSETLEKSGIYLRSWHGAGAISGYLLREHSAQQHTRWDDMPQAAQEASLWSYYGGRVELFQQGFLPAPIYDYDINSAYPSAIINLPSLRYGEWRYLNNELNLYDPLCDHAVWYLEWDTSEHVLSWLAPFPQRGKDGRIYWLTSGKGWYHAAEVRAARKIFGPHIHIKHGIYLLPDDINYKPFSWVEQIMLDRLEYKRRDDPRHIVLKLGANSLYGKLAQGTDRNGHRPKFQNYFLAGEVTAVTRAKCLTLASNFLHSELVCIATDGVFTRHPSDTLASSDLLGEWQLQEPIQEDSFWAQAGVFYTNKGRVKRTRGFNAASVTYEMCMDALAHYRGRDSWRVLYEERRFTGLGYAASTGNWGEYRQWIDRNRELTLRTEPRKECVEWDGKSGYLYPGHMFCEAVPYRPKEQMVQELKRYPEELLAYFDAIEQEEYLGSE